VLVSRVMVPYRHRPTVSVTSVKILRNFDPLQIRNSINRHADGDALMFASDEL